MQTLEVEADDETQLISMQVYVIRWPMQSSAFAVLDAVDRPPKR